MDQSAAAGVLTLDLHRLDLRYAPLRLPDPPAIVRLARSIEADGQLVPCIAVAGEDEAFILVDGYRRIAALRHLGRDTAEVECWQADLAQALLGVLARSRSRSFAPIEEAFLLRELISGAQLSQHEVARRCGRDVSWVSRRLQLLGGLSDALLDGRTSGAGVDLGGGSHPRTVGARQRRACRTTACEPAQDATVDAAVGELVRAVSTRVATGARAHGRVAAALARSRRGPAGREGRRTSARGAGRRGARRPSHPGSGGRPSEAAFVRLEFAIDHAAVRRHGGRGFFATGARVASAPSDKGLPS
jgi:hypothetical protein